MYTRPIVAELSMDAEENGCCWVFINGQPTQVPAVCANRQNFPTCSPDLPTGTLCVISTPRNPIANVTVCGFANPAQCFPGQPG